MSKDKVKLNEDHKEIIRSVAHEAVEHPDDYFKDEAENGDLGKLKEEISKNPKHIEDAVYKELKEDAKAKYRGEEVQEDDHKLHILKKLKYVATEIAEFVHDLISPFIPVLTSIANAKVAEQIQANPNIPEEYKGHFIEASQSAVEKIGDGVAGLDFSDEAAHDEVAAAGESA